MKLNKKELIKINSQDTAGSLGDCDHLLDKLF